MNRFLHDHHPLDVPAGDEGVKEELEEGHMDGLDEGKHRFPGGSGDEGDNSEHIVMLQCTI